ncbi:peptidase inhibitor family I36 protein [Dactylosporangium sp. NPDC051484]|uniref:peptidase inhibitor family I36 protein n=1 Tax=Dactylosporangium sp. NPDC051484 TaxID=3154942 RepID=UPI00344B2095
MPPLGDGMWKTCAGFMAALALAGAAAAAPVGSDVAAYLTAYPGGRPVGGSDISYAGGSFVVTVTAPRQQTALVDCPSGWFCFYDRPDYGYPRGKLSSCGWQSLASWGWQDRVESAYYNLSRGSVQFLDGGYGLFQIGVGARAIGDASPYRNMATDVYRYC